MNIEKEIELVKTYKHLLDPEFVNWKDGLGFMQIGDGWTNVVENALATIEHRRVLIEKYSGEKYAWSSVPLDIKISSIKEKFSSLRINFSVHETHRAWCEGVVASATEMASNTCECCGSMERSTLGMTSGWLTIICKPCHDKKPEDWRGRNKWRHKSEVTNIGI